VNEIKLLDNEVNNLRNQVFYLNGLLDKIDSLLEDEIIDSQEVVDEFESGNRPICTDGTDQIIVGRHEFATGLRKQIEKLTNGENFDDS